MSDETKKEKSAKTKRRVASKEKRTELRAELFASADRGELDLREALKTMRKIAGRSQIEYAKLVGVSPRVLIEFERGGGNPTIETLEKILAPFGLELTLRRKRAKGA